MKIYKIKKKRKVTFMDCGIQMSLVNMMKAKSGVPSFKKIQKSLMPQALFKAITSLKYVVIFSFGHGAINL